MQLSKWAALCVWEPILNKHMAQYDLVFDKVICIKKVKSLSYVAYYTVKDLKKDLKFCQINVKFDKFGRIRKSYIMTWRECDKAIIRLCEGEEFIFDKREDFEWLDSDSDSCFSFKE